MSAHRALVISVAEQPTADSEAPGAVLRDALVALEFIVDGPVAVADGHPVEVALRSGLEQGFSLIVTTGGAGVGPADVTPEMTRRVIQREVPGIAEAVRASGMRGHELWRGIAGLADHALIVNLPGTVGGVRDAVTAVGPALRAAVDVAAAPART